MASCCTISESKKPIANVLFEIANLNESKLTASGLETQ
ncbi:hypothetical protein CKA32_002733 [Geitlerinema sp. FC II]|nr:hypothetical protein CKA32_002733 [Geitlerinema sp. FC II]